MKIENRQFGKTKDGSPTILFTLSNDSEVSISITNYGGIITNLNVPDKYGNVGDIVLGFDCAEDYVHDSPYFGAIVGRYGNRIKEGKFSLNGNEYNLAQNDNRNHLHGGILGFDKVLWDAQEIQGSDYVGLLLAYTSLDGEEGYPGNLEVQVKYRLSNSNELIIEYSAETDKPTICNLTNHTYFNLKDGGESSILDHEVQFFAEEFIPIDSHFIPIGYFTKVKGTPFDFTKPKSIGEEINKNHEQLLNGRGFDHTYIVDGRMGEMRPAAIIKELSSGRILELFTEEPGFQFYSGNFLDGSLKGKKDVVYNHRNGLCLETQHYPDSPNHPKWPSVELIPGDVYNSSTVYKFSVVT